MKIVIIYIIPKLYDSTAISFTHTHTHNRLHILFCVFHERKKLIHVRNDGSE